MSDLMTSRLCPSARSVRKPDHAALRHRVATQLPMWFIRLLGRPRESSKSGTDSRRPKLLICPVFFGWVPNGPSEQLERKPARREEFLTCPDAPR
jgi:hypothetical protein